MLKNIPTQTLIEKHTKEYLLFLMFDAKIGDDYEAHYVYDVVWNNLSNNEYIIPQLVKHQGKELADRGLISIGFFREYLSHLTNQHGYPSKEFFAKKCKEEYFSVGQKDLSNHFDDWTDYLHEKFKPKADDTSKLKAASVYDRLLFHKCYPDQRQWKMPGFLKKGMD